jgi:hypothetical protein
MGILIDHKDQRFPRTHLWASDCRTESHEKSFNSYLSLHLTVHRTLLLATVMPSNYQVVSVHGGQRLGKKHVLLVILD